MLFLSIIFNFFVSFLGPVFFLFYSNFLLLLRSILSKLSFPFYFYFIQGFFFNFFFLLYSTFFSILFSFLKVRYIVTFTFYFQRNFFLFSRLTVFFCFILVCLFFQLTFLSTITLTYKRSLHKFSQKLRYHLLSVPSNLLKIYFNSPLNLVHYYLLFFMFHLPNYTIGLISTFWANFFRLSFEENNETASFLFLNVWMESNCIYQDFVNFHSLIQGVRHTNFWMSYFSRVVIKPFVIWRRK